MFAGLLASTRKCHVIIYARGYSLVDSFFKGGKVRRWLIRTALMKAERVIAPNPDLANKITQIGIPRDRIVEIPPFIPPGELPEVARLPDQVRSFCAGKRPILIANGAYKIINDQEVYGLCAMSRLVAALRPEFPNLAVVVFLRAGGDRGAEVFRDLAKELETPDRKASLLFYESNSEFVPLYGIADVFLRPTTTDGDANSVREALHFGVPVVASDVIPRPEGCRTYNWRSYEALLSCTRDVLSNLDTEKERARNAPHHNAAQHLIPLYRSLIGL